MGVAQAAFSPIPVQPAAIVTEADLERELATVRALAAGRAGGAFGPSSVVWRVNREAAIFLAAGRALLLQLAHPWVAAAITEHSRSLTDPIGRFHRTFGFVFTMVFGTTDEAIAAARRLHHRHAAIGGVLAESSGVYRAGSLYSANDVAALRWVFATLADSAIVAFELVNPPLTAEERERYYTEARMFAAFFGIPQSALPPSWPAFAAYFQEMVASDNLAVSSAARATATALFASAGTWLRSPFWYRALTASLLPARLRDQFGLAYGPAEQRAARWSNARLRFLYPRIPLRLRYVAPYHEACARLAGRQPGTLTRGLNRFWIGRDSMAG
jgi:uncharacterized protein (DUF2236 family)